MAVNIVMSIAAGALLVAITCIVYMIISLVRYRREWRRIDKS
jgi:hypothetical protein